MSINTNILSDVIVHNKYAKYIAGLGRREIWSELAQRNMDMHIEKFPFLKDQIEYYYNNYVLTKKVLPSMRSLQFAGKPIEVNPSRIFNCSALPIDHYRAFSETMFLLLSGTGVGYNIQKEVVDKLPLIYHTKSNTIRYVIGDSIEGWSDAIKMLMKSYFLAGPKIIFDYSDIREKGAQLITSGGKAPGPAPLKKCIEDITTILENALVDKKHAKLTPIEVHDILCHIANSVLSGGIRRSAMISLFSHDDEEMLTCKSGEWWIDNPQRALANNSAVLVRSEMSKESFYSIMQKTKDSNSGEPGIFLTNDKDWITNPCCEIALRPYQMCNLVEINAHDIETQEELNERAQAASFIATLQATYTNFHYLRPIWRITTEKDALLGVSMTGIASGKVLNLDLIEAALLVNRKNAEVAREIGINPAARTTCIKPAGTSSLVLGTSSGIHAWHSKYYIRRIRIMKNEAIYYHLLAHVPDLLEDDVMDSENVAILSIPVQAPEGAITREESAIDLLERIKKVKSEWIDTGHIHGENTHNVSATINVKEDEWEEVIDWMWNNQDSYNGLSLLPYDGGSYIQAPFEEITEEKYIELSGNLKNIDLSVVFEFEDNTNLIGEIACSGGMCEII